MSQEIAAVLQEAPSPPPTIHILSPDHPPALPTSPKSVQVNKSNNQIKIIEIQDSDDAEAQPTKVSKPKDNKPLSGPPKPKKLTIRCMLCREPGKKTTMKACLDCKGFSHISCLEQEGQQVIRHLCRKCRHKREENHVLKKNEKGGGQEKSSVRRLEKEKKREQHLKKLGQFQARYPYYFQDEKVRFPIEDKLLFIYRQIFDISECPRPKPIPHPVIPSSLLADLLQIQNFFSTFRNELVAFGTLPSQINKNIFYLSMGSKGLDGVFCCLLECLLNVYLSDIIDKNKTDNVRILNDHSFFTLLIQLHDNEQLSQEVLIRTAKEIIRYLATIPSMKIAFEEFTYPEQMELEQKIQIILQLIKGLSQIDQFHDLVSIKSEKMQQLTKEKTELVSQLKSDQAQNLSNNEKLKDMSQAQKKMEDSQQGVTRLLTKELDKHKKKMLRLASQQTKSEEIIKEIRKKIGDIGKVMPFLTSQILFLGKDRNDSQFFFYLREPNRIYVKLRAYLLDKSEHFYIYETKQSISQLLKSLNTKGLKERHLFETIQSLLKDQIITNDVPIDDSSNFMLEEEKYRQITFQNIVEMIKQTQDTFSTYLTVKQYQWASPSSRQLFMDQFVLITDLHVLKENIKALQQNFLFSEYVSVDIPGKRMEQSDEEMREQVREEAREGRKKIPIRIWGINSEKTKKYWVQYLEECIDVLGVWLCAFIFKNTVDKYVKKKMETYYEQQLKQQRMRPRQNGRGRPTINRIQNQRVERRPKVIMCESSQEVIQSRRPNLRVRKAKKMNIVSIPFTQDSDIDIENQSEEPEEEQSSNEDCCQICGQYGEMICCDTCPKVYHTECLRIKDVPEGEWSCLKCLERMSNERQTRSRVKKVGKFL